jgi:hypothetical protein
MWLKGNMARQVTPKGGMNTGRNKLVQAIAAALLGGVFGAFIGNMAQPRALRESFMPRATETKEPSRFERRDVPTRPIWIFVAGLLFVMLVTLIAITAMQYWFMGYGMPPRAEPPSLNPPAHATLPSEPRLEAVPGGALREMLARDNAQLNSYGWLDENAGAVHIPIQRAMELVQSRLPVAAEDAAKRFEDAGNDLPSSSSSGRVMEQVYP